MTGTAARRVGTIAKVAVRAVITVIVLAVVVPLWVVVAGLNGLQPTHWSGTRLGSIELPPYTPPPMGTPEPANLLIAAAQAQEEGPENNPYNKPTPFDYVKSLPGGDQDDLAPSYWDADARQVVLGALTEAGVERRRALGETSEVPYRIERRPYSTRRLREIQEEITTWIEPGIMMSGVDPEHGRTVFTFNALSHGLFTDLHARYGDAVEIQFAPTMQPAQLYSFEIGAAVPPVEELGPDPVGTWFTLATGFPWYLGTALVVGTGIWFVPRVFRRVWSVRTRQVRAG